MHQHLSDVQNSARKENKKEANSCCIELGGSIALTSAEPIPENFSSVFWIILADFRFIFGG